MEGMTSRRGGTGRGAPVVLIHGFAEDGFVWDRQVQYLMKDHQLIIPDLPGSGKSSPLDAETSMEEFGDAIKKILDAENIDQAILIGHSMGGYISLAFAEKYGDRLAALGLFHSTAFADSEEKKALRRKSIEFILRHGSETFIRQSIPNLFAEPSKERHPEWVEEVIGRYWGFTPDSLVHYYRAMIQRPDRAAILQKIARPVLFVIGEHDNTIPLSDSLKQIHMPELSSIHILDQTGHMGMLEETERSNTILDEFLNFVQNQQTQADRPSHNTHHQ
jgi:pimeloyl-ACP methyl ester carboxylesterase